MRKRFAHKTMLILCSHSITHSFTHSVIQTVFDSCDYDRVGRIHINQLSGLLIKLGKTDGELGACYS